MKFLAKFWALLLAIALLIGSAYLYFYVYKTEKLAHEVKKAQLEMMITALQNTIAENALYVDVQPLLEPATAEVEASRLELYEHFPVEMKEEDQIMYVLYLETLFKNEIYFEFGDPQVLTPLSDGSHLMGLVLTANYEDVSYDGFKDLITYLSTDSRITSVHQASIQWNEDTDTVSGSITVILYLLDTELKEYEAPDIHTPDYGKDNLYD